ncbi:hypothetical protein [Parendozoicomonas sp. Alg238-R29]|uniref:hypothetical protein n=1 Tax=Parendozoicomonas sp. Alg238-R29 TaxID=2993446 RepID=UPI00248E9BF6|nr:hypothetical protein [Parendozoicomonas sp. Alg238-R29]
MNISMIDGVPVTQNEVELLVRLDRNDPTMRPAEREAAVRVFLELEDAKALLAKQATNQPLYSNSNVH